jgi:hypothetical protein
MDEVSLPEIVSQYGNRKKFDEALLEGYTKLTYGGGGKLKDGEMPVAVFACSGSYGCIRVIGVAKVLSEKGTLVQEPIDRIFSTKEDFHRYVGKHEISMTSRQIELASVVKRLELKRNLEK